MDIKRHLRRCFQKLGYDVSRYSTASPQMLRRKHMLAAYGVDTVLDVGANSGQFAQGLRKEAGYAGRILSFEPLGTAFARLQAAAQNDRDWQVFHHALGDTTGEQQIHIAGNSYSSSLLEMLPAHADAAPHSRYVGSERIVIKTLDSIFQEIRGTSRNIYLKIDTQGFEHKVIQGAEESLAHIDTVEMELSLVPLYEGGTLLPEMCLLMRSKGYALVAIEEEFTNPSTGQILQMNGIFHRLGKTSTK
jgi:FkbM family methyltransferase